MEKGDKKDLYKALLKRQESFIVFLAAGETDLDLLPEPITKAERLLYELCKEKAEAPMKELESAILAAKHPTDSETPQGNTIDNEESCPKPAEPEQKKAAPKRTRKK